MSVVLRLGDCRDLIGEVADGASNPVIVSDPPFNIGYHYGVCTDDMEDGEYWAMMRDVFGRGPCAVVHYPEALYRLAFELGRVPDKVCSWVYNANTPRQHRDVAYFGVTPDMTRMTQPYKNPGDRRVRRLMAEGRTGGRLYDWWNVNQVKNVSSEKLDHPCQMPSEVMCNIVGVLPPDCTVIDPFMGTGTTGEAVLRLNVSQGASRSFVGIELDPSYFGTASRRLRRLEGLRTLDGFSEAEG